MAKPVGKRFRIILGVAGLLSALIGVLLWRAGRLPTFRFLDGRTPVCQGNTRDLAANIYCFEGSFNDLCAAATAELSSRGFREDAGGGSSSPDYNRIFVKGKHDEIRVSLKNFAFEEATPGSISWVHRPGWVSVEVRRTRTRAHLWERLPANWQVWYQRHVLKSKTITIKRPGGVYERRSE